MDAPRVGAVMSDHHSPAVEGLKQLAREPVSRVHVQRPSLLRSEGHRFGQLPPEDAVMVRDLKGSQAHGIVRIAVQLIVRPEGAAEEADVAHHHAAVVEQVDALALEGTLPRPLRALQQRVAVEVVVAKGADHRHVPADIAFEPFECGEWLRQDISGNYTHVRLRQGVRHDKVITLQMQIADHPKLHSSPPSPSAGSTEGQTQPFVSSAKVRGVKATSGMSTPTSRERPTPGS